MKKTALFLIFLFSIVLSYSQSPQNASTETLCGLTNEDFFTKSDIVIKGDYMGGPVGFYETITDGKTDTNIIFPIRISEVYKGDQSMRWHTVYVVKRGMDTDFFKWNYSIYGTVPNPVAPDVIKRNSKGSAYSYGMSAIYFLSKSDVINDDIPERYAGKVPSEYRYEFMCGDSSRLYVFTDKILGLNNLVFQNENELFDYMDQFEGYATSLYRLKPRRQVEPEKEEIEYQKVLPTEMDSAKMKIMRERWSGDIKKKVLTHPAKSGGNDLTLQMANQRVIYDSVANKYYVKFDLLASSNNPNIFFDGADLLP